MQQAYVLTYIHYNSSCKISEICDHMLVSPAAASQMVDRLESQNLAARIADPEDRRVRSVLLTEQGKTFVYQSIEARSKWARVVPAELNDKELNQISNALQMLVSIYRQE